MQHLSIGASLQQQFNNATRTPAPGAVHAGRSRSFLGFRFVPHDAMHGPHITEDFTITRPGGFVNRGTARTAIALPPEVAQKMSVDPAFQSAVLHFCTDRRAALEKTTVVYDPARDLGIDRLFPKWLYAGSDGKQCRDAIACAMPPRNILDLASTYPNGFTATDAWRKWCESLPVLQPASVAPDTGTLPQRIAALVLGNPAYFTTPEYRAWIGRAKQRKREEIISRELAAMFATAVSPAPHTTPPTEGAEGVRIENHLDHSATGA